MNEDVIYETGRFENNWCETWKRMSFETLNIDSVAKMSLAQQIYLQQ